MRIKVILLYNEAIDEIIRNINHYMMNYLLRPGLDNMSTEDIFKMIENIIKNRM
jgi:hypothetical protein